MMGAGETIHRYIVQSATKRFLMATGEWTEAIERAMVFPSFTAVLRTCREHGLRNVEVLMQPIGSTAGIRIPLRC
jgi:hypothetical protein